MRLHKKLAVTGLLCILLCVSLSACGESVNIEKDTSQMTEASAEGENAEEPSSTTPTKEYDISLPQDITVELFGLDILRTKRSRWEEHIYNIKNPDTNISYYTSYFVGDYEITHYWMDADKSVFVTGILSQDRASGAQVIFDENGKVSELSIDMDMGEYFNTSVLNIGDNAREFVESIKPGTWDKLLAEEALLTEQGFYMVHYTTSSDVLMVSNEDFSISYFLEDGLVDSIYIRVEGDIPLKEDGSSIYDLDRFDYYLYGADIAAMSLRDWLDIFDFKEYIEDEVYCKEVWMNILDFSENNIDQRVMATSCETLLAGKEVAASISYIEHSEYKWWNIDMYSATDPEVWLGIISFDIFQNGSITIYLDIRDNCPMITSNFVVPGDNIKTLLNSYEEGLFEKILSLNADDVYCIGPYEFTFVRFPESSEGSIGIRKTDEGAMDRIAIDFSNEIVTSVSRTYRGNISGFEEKMSLQ